MEDDFVFGGNYWPILPANRNYEVQCIHFETKWFVKTKKLFLHFKIIEPGEYCNIKIFMAFSMPYDGKVKQGSKYYKTWVMVNRWQKPSRNSKMSPRIFLNKIYTIKTRTVKPPHNGKAMPEAFWYSVVDEILE